MTPSRECRAVDGENFWLLVEAMSDAVFVHERGVVRYANPAMAALLGFGAPSEILGANGVELFVHPDDRQTVIEYFSSRREAGESRRVLRVRWVRRDGTTIHVEGTGTDVTFDGGKAAAVVVRDVTDGIRALEAHAQVERALRMSEERYRALFESSPVSIVLFDVETLAILAVNEATVRLYGYDREAFLGMKLTDLKVHEDVELDRLVESGPARGTWRGTKKHRTKEGLVIDVEIASHPLLVEGRHAVLSLMSDATERTRLAEQLRQAHKMEALGQFAGGIAHDFNNILAVILGDANFIRGELGETHPLSADVREIEAATQRGAALTSQMLTFSRQQPSQPCALSLNERVADLGKMLARIIGEHIQLTTHLDVRLGSIEADPGQVDQVLLNLIVNARDAMPQGGSLTIETTGVDLSDAEACRLGMESGRCACLIVTDTGVGMDAATRARLFEPFFTTKEVGKGTGLGLATVFGIVKRARGGISVESEPGQGSTFRLFFPLMEAADAARPSERPSAGRIRGTETILLVEDEEPVRRVVRRLLASRGYRVLEANGAAAAFEIFARPGPMPDLVLTDLVMPEMDGRTMVDELRVRFPAVRVLFMSGYTEHPTLKGSILSASEQLIHKPFTGEQMTTAVRSALSSPRARADL